MAILTRKQVISLKKREKKLKRALSNKKRKLARLSKSIEKLEEEVYTAFQVDEIYEGVPINRGFCWMHEVTHRDEYRAAHVYQNASNDKLWGLTIEYHHPRASVIGRKEAWAGSTWKSFEEADKAAKDWIAHGKLPIHSITGERLTHP